MFAKLNRIVMCAAAVTGTISLVPNDLNLTRAATLFSVETISDSLVTIDATTGLITTIGTLDFDAIRVDLASFDDRLFALDSDFQNRVDIYEIDPSTAATISSAQVFLGGNAILNGESLTNFGSQLKIGFSANGGDTSSESLGDLSLTGEVTNVVSTTSDLDGLGGDGISQFFSTDVEGGTGDTSLFSVNLTTGALAFLDEFPSNPVDDLVVRGEELFLLASGTLTILSDGAIANTFSLSGGSYQGIAVASADVPEPSAILGLGATIGIGAFLNRNRQKARFR